VIDARNSTSRRVDCAELQDPDAGHKIVIVDAEQTVTTSQDRTYEGND
jgi:hypothetical protein